MLFTITSAVLLYLIIGRPACGLFLLLIIMIKLFPFVLAALVASVFIGGSIYLLFFKERQ